MTHYDDDRWEFDPEGEGRSERDPTNSTAVDDDSYERAEDSIEDDQIGYLDTPGPDSRGTDKPTEYCYECVLRSIPAERSAISASQTILSTTYLANPIRTVKQQI